MFGDSGATLSDLDKKFVGPQLFDIYVKPSIWSRPLSEDGLIGDLSIGASGIFTLSTASDSGESEWYDGLDCLALVDNGFNCSAVLDSLPFPWKQDSVSKLLHNVEQYERACGIKYLFAFLPDKEHWSKDYSASAEDVYSLLHARGYRVVDLSALEQDTGTSYFEELGRTLLVLPLLPDVSVYTESELNRFLSSARSQADSTLVSKEEAINFWDILFGYMNGDLSASSTDNVASDEELASVAEIEFSDIADVVVPYVSGAHPTDEEGYREFLMEMLECEVVVPLVSC